MASVAVISLSKINRTKTQSQQSVGSHHDWKNRNTSMISESQMHVYDDHKKQLSLSDKICRITCDRLPMLHPFGPFRTTWDIFVMLLLIYTSLEVPFTLGFDIILTLHGKLQLFGLIALFIDMLLLCDLVLNFRTAYFDRYDNLRLITNPKHIAKRYLSRWFIIDLVTSFPFEFILPPNNAHADNVSTYLKMLRIFRLFRIFKVLRVLKMVKIFNSFISHIIGREIVMAMRLIKVLCLSLLTAHICACLWYYVGCKSYSVYDDSWLSHQGMVSSQCGMESGSAQEHDLFYLYSYSWYWSVVTLFTTGYGDVVATNPYEQWTASLVILVGTCLFGYFVGTMTSLITEGDKVSSSIVGKLEDAQHFCQQKQLPPSMARAVMTHTRYHCHNNYVLGDENDVLSNLPSYLAMDVSLYISHKYLEHLDFLANKFVDPYVRGLIAFKMKSISCNKDFKLFVKGDIAEKIYIQRIGKALHIIHGNKNQTLRKHKQILQRGDVVGEYSLILKKRNSTLICQTWCEFYVLDVNDIKDILQQHYGQNWLKKLTKIKRFIKSEYVKSIKKRKKRRCSLHKEPLLPTQSRVDDHDDAYGQSGHCDWGEENTTLRHLETMTRQVLTANEEEDDIAFSLNALSRNAHRITQLTGNSKDKSMFLKTQIKKHKSSSPMQFAAQTQSLSKRSKKALFRLAREDSFVRNIQVTKSYFHQNDSDNSSDSDDDFGGMEYNDKTYEVELEQPKTTDMNRTMDIAEFIQNEAEFLDKIKPQTIEKNQNESTILGLKDHQLNQLQCLKNVSVTDNQLIFTFHEETFIENGHKKDIEHEVYDKKDEENESEDMGIPDIALDIGSNRLEDNESFSHNTDSVDVYRTDEPSSNTETMSDGRAVVIHRDKAKQKGYTKKKRIKNQKTFKT